MPFLRRENRKNIKKIDDIDIKVCKYPAPVNFFEIHITKNIVIHFLITTEKDYQNIKKVLESVLDLNLDDR